MLMSLMDQVELALKLQAGLALVTFQKLKELAMSVGNWMKMKYSSLILKVAVVLEVECVAVVVLLAQEEELVLLQV